MYMYYLLGWKGYITKNPQKMPVSDFLQSFVFYLYIPVKMLIVLLSDSSGWIPAEKVWSLWTVRFSFCLSTTMTTREDSFQTTTRTSWLWTETRTSTLKPWFYLWTGQRCVFLKTKHIDLSHFHVAKHK